jgi:hypothetical protein
MIIGCKALKLYVTKLFQTVEIKFSYVRNAKQHYNANYEPSFQVQVVL